MQKLFNIVPRSQNGVYDTIFSGNVTGINCLAFKMVLDCRNSCAQLSGFGNLNCCRGFELTEVIAMDEVFIDIITFYNVFVFL